MLQPTIPLYPQAGRFASPCIPTYLLYAIASYVLCRQTWYQPVSHGLLLLPRMHASACSNVPLHTFPRTKSHSAQATQRSDTGLVCCWKKSLIAPLEAWLRNADSVLTGGSSILLETIAFNSLHNKPLPMEREHKFISSHLFTFSVPAPLMRAAR